MELQKILNQIKESAKANFDESVEVVINLISDKKNPITLRTTVSLPHGTGKVLRIKAVDTDSADSFVKEMTLKDGKAPKIDFDILIAEPGAMAKLSKVAKILGPKGLMPNPKNGTVTENLEKTKKELSGGKIEIKTETNAPIVHTTIGKVSFEEKKLEENYNTVIKAIEEIKPKSITSAFLKSTMGKSHKVL